MESVAAFAWNGWQPSRGISGRLGLEYAADYLYDGESILLGRKGTVDKPIYINGRFWTVDTMFYTVISPYADGRFLYYAALTIPFSMYSTNTALPSMTKESISGHMMAIPPSQEQSTIAAFLDHETAKIDALVEEQKRLIGLLNEKRQAVISHAVTKGLDPNVPMKDSGVEWLGEVPAHWKLIALSRISPEKCDGPFGSKLKSNDYVDEGARVIRLQNIRRGWFDDSDAAFVSLDYFKSELIRHQVLRDDLLVAGLGDDKNPVGRACVAPPGIGQALVKADCFRFRLDKVKAMPRFVAHQLSAGAEADAGFLATGSTRSRIPLSTMAARVVALPPLDEQEEIVRFLHGTEEAHGELLMASKKSIELMTEHRSALISAAVTGKIDVRAWKPPKAASSAFKTTEAKESA